MADFEPGTFSWLDLTVDDAPGVRDFYEAVVGWSSDDVDMGGYSDFNMCGGAERAPVAGICHARGANAGLPAQWLVYVNVADLDESLSVCESRGGTILRQPTKAGPGRIAVIQDPAGACLALFQAENS